jgi:hypothetical protein
MKMKLRSKDIKAFSQPLAIKEENLSAKRKSSDQGATSNSNLLIRFVRKLWGSNLLSSASLLNPYCWMMNLLIRLLALNLCGVKKLIFIG